MTIVERIQLHKLGYTKEEINELAKENYDPKGLEEPPKSVEDVQNDPELAPDPPKPSAPDGQPDGQPDPQAEILKAIQGLTSAIQQSNIVKSRQPEAPKETAEDILHSML